MKNVDWTVETTHLEGRFKFNCRELDTCDLFTVVSGGYSQFVSLYICPHVVPTLNPGNEKGAKIQTNHLVSMCDANVILYTIR